jgi:hypothetical protein
MACVTIPKNLKFKPIFLFPVGVITTIESADVETVVETLVLTQSIELQDQINSYSKLKVLESSNKEEKT